MKKPTIKWKREAKSTGKWSSFENNDARGWNASMGKDKLIGSLYDPSRSNFSKADPCWRIMYYAKQGGNIILQRSFPLDKLEEAKKFLEELYFKIIESTEGQPYYDFKQRIKIYE